MSADKRYVAAWPTYPEPTPLRDDNGEVVTFPTRQEAIRYADRQGVPYPADNVRPARDTEPGECRWCLEWATGGDDCPYHGEQAQVEGDSAA